MADDLGRLLLEAYRAFERDVSEAFVEADLTGMRAAFVTVYVHLDPEGTRLTDLARRTAMTKQAMADLVGDMQGDGLVRRVPDPEDGRARLVLATAKGKRRLGRARRVVDRVEGRYRRHLGERRHEALRAALGTFRTEEEA